MLLSNPLGPRLRSGKVSVGSWLNLASPLSAELMANEGFDWLAVDLEHAPWGLAEAANAFRAIEARGAVPLARPWTHDPEVIARILDCGALGVVVPHVSNRSQAEALVQAVRYPPAGKRSSGTGRNQTYADYQARANDEILLIPQIEDPEGVENIDEIMSVPGVDVGFLGPNDLGLAMGLRPGEAAKSPKHRSMLLRVLEGCKKAGKPAGIPVPNGAEANNWIELGFQMIDLSNDLALLRNAVRAELAAVKRRE